MCTPTSVSVQISSHLAVIPVLLPRLAVHRLLVAVLLLLPVLLLAATAMAVLLLLPVLLPVATATVVLLLVLPLAVTGAEMAVATAAAVEPSVMLIPANWPS